MRARCVSPPRTGLLESIYRRALVIELVREGLRVEAEKEITIYYAGQAVGIYRLDMVVEGRIILELKAAESLHRVHYAQLRSYLKATGLKTGLLINFCDQRADFRRIDVP